MIDQLLSLLLVQSKGLSISLYLTPSEQIEKKKESRQTQRLLAFGQLPHFSHQTTRLNAHGNFKTFFSLVVLVKTL